MPPAIAAATVVLDSVCGLHQNRRMTQTRFRTLAVLAVVTTMLVACSDDGTPTTPQNPAASGVDGPDPSGEPDANGDASPATGPDGFPVVNIIVRGLAEEPVADGFVKLEAGCDDRATAQEASFGAFEVQVPDDWESTSASKSPDSGDANYTIDDMSKELSISFREAQRGQTPEEILQSVSLGEDLVEAFTVTWGEETHPVFRAGQQYLAAFPVIETDAVMGIPIFAQVQFGYGTGETDDIDEATVQQVFESVTVLECGVEPYISIYRNSEVTRKG